MDPWGTPTSTGYSCEDFPSRNLTDKVKVRKKTEKVKSQKLTHPTAYLNNPPVIRSSSQKDLDIHLYEKLNFILHIKKKNFKANKGINAIKKLNNALYKSFVRPNLDYGDIIYDQTNNESFCNKLETVQCNAALVTTGSIKSLWVTKSHKLELFWFNSTHTIP